RCDWTLTACQEERAAVLRPKNSDTSRTWTTVEYLRGRIYTLLNTRAVQGAPAGCPCSGCRGRRGS
ncbi:Hypothetical predicted protein, partial [Scomber scombrus]